MGGDSMKAEVWGPAEERGNMHTACTQYMRLNNVLKHSATQNLLHI